MRTFVIGVVAVVGGLGFATRADAQVMGTYGTPHSTLGYYSPYPGALYSPFRQPDPVYVRPSYYNPGFNTGGYYNPGFNNNYRDNYPSYPQYRPNNYPNPGYNRRW